MTTHEQLEKELERHKKRMKEIEVETEKEYKEHREMSLDLLIKIEKGEWKMTGNCELCEGINENE